MLAIVLDLDLSILPRRLPKSNFLCIYIIIYTLYLSMSAIVYSKVSIGRGRLFVIFVFLVLICDDKLGRY